MRATDPRLLAIAGGIANSVIAGLVFPYVTVYLTHQAGYTLTQAGEAVGLATAANVGVRMLAGSVIDRLAPARAAWLGLLLAAALPLLLLAWPSRPAVFVGLLAYTLGGIFFDSAITLLVYAEGRSEVDRKLDYSRYYAAHNAFLALAPAVTFLTSPRDYRTLFLAALALQAVLLAGSARFALRPRADAGPARPARARTLDRAGFASLTGAGFLSVFALSACYSLVYRQYVTNIAGLLGHATLLGRELYPLIVAINGAFVIVFQPLYARLVRRGTRLDFPLAGAACLVAGFALLALPVPVVASALPFALLFTLAEVLLNLGMVDRLMAFAPATSRATWLNWFALSRMSSAVGVPAGAWLLEHWGGRAFVAGLVAAALSMGLLAAESSRLLARSRANTGAANLEIAG